MLGTPISALGGWPTVSGGFVRLWCRAKKPLGEGALLHMGVVKAPLCNTSVFLRHPYAGNDHRGRTHYGKLRRGGYPLGSGGMESSNKFICHVRLKRSGAWWYEESSNQMLALRCAKYNGTFDQVFTRYQHQKAES